MAVPKSKVSFLLSNYYYYCYYCYYRLVDQRKHSRSCLLFLFKGSHIFQFLADKIFYCFESTLLRTAYLTIKQRQSFFHTPCNFL
jgi:hypothetical protein